MAQLADLLDALERAGDQPGRPVSAHLDPALNEAAKAAVALGLAESVSALTGTALHAELRRLALRAVLDVHYARRPDDRPHVAEVALDNPAAPVTADANRLLRVAYDDELTRVRAVEAGQLRVRSHHGRPSLTLMWPCGSRRLGGDQTTRRHRHRRHL